MVCDLFVDAYRAGASGGDNAYATARGSRARLIEKIRELYDEIESLKQERDDYLRELEMINEDIPKDGTLGVSFHNGRYDAAFNAMFPGCTPDDLPFPDVETMAAAEEVEGANE